MGSPSPNPTSEVPDTFMPRAPAARRQLVRLIGERAQHRCCPPTAVSEP